MRHPKPDLPPVTVPLVKSQPRLKWPQELEAGISKSCADVPDYIPYAIPLSRLDSNKYPMHKTNKKQIEAAKERIFGKS